MRSRHTRAAISPPAKDEMVVAALQVMNWKVANDHEADAGAVGLVAYERLCPRSMQR